MSRFVAGVRKEGVSLDALSSADSREPDERRFEVRVGSAMLAEALVATGRRAGWRPVVQRRSGEVLVTDRFAPRDVSGPAGDVVLVCDLTPVAARRALDGVAGLWVSAVACADVPDDLVAALEGITAGRVSLPVRVVELAALLPSLTERQWAALDAVVAGRPNAEIARMLSVSSATVKRELCELYAALDASTRTELAARAVTLGVGVTRNG